MLRPVLRTLTLLITFSWPCLAQDASKIIEQYLRTAGGSKAFAKIQTLTLEGTLTTPGSEKSGTFTLHTRLPNRFYSEIIFADQQFIEAYNGKSAWHQDPANGLATLTGPEAIQLEAASAYYNSHLTGLKNRKLTATIVGHTAIRGRDTIQLDIASATGVHRQVFFDAQSHLIAKESAPIAGVDEEILYSDYRGESGIQLPHSLELCRGSNTYQITITRAAINVPVGERVFDFPRKSQVQLPDLKALFKEIDDNQKAIDKIKENYAGTRDTEETEYDGSGKIKKREVRQHTFFYLNGHEIATLVMKDGKPLSDADQKRENERVQKRIAELQKRDAKKEAKKEKGQEEANEDKSDPGIEVFLRACQFVNPRRERFRGQDVLVFDFEPNPDFTPRKLEEKVAHQLAGVVWIDEKAHDVARLEAYFVRDFKLAGGLVVNLQKGTNFVFEQAFINNEVWLPTYEEAHVGARVLLVKMFKVNEVTRYSNYRKFKVETLSTVAPPKTQP